MNFTSRTLIVLAVGGRFRAGVGTGLSEQTGAHPRRLRARRRHRHHGARDRRQGVGFAQAAVRGREPSGCERQHRGESGGRCAGRRLHDIVHVGGAHHEQARLQKPRLRHRARFRADHGGHQRAQRAVPASVAAGEDGEGVDRAGEIQARRAHLRDFRRRQPRAFCRRDVQDDDGHRYAGDPV